jgi:hypothetical protein
VQRLEEGWFPVSVYGTTSGRGQHRAAGSSDKFRDALNDVARFIYGTSNRKLSKGSEMRYNERGSLCIYVSGPKKGTWSDFENDAGGGTLDLVIYAGRARDRAEAAQWCEDNGFIKSDEPKKPKSNGRGPQGELEEKYYYPNLDGEVVFEVWRYDPKDFRPHLPNGKAGLPDESQLVVYRLPEVTEAIASGHTIYICEGEKDANAAVAIGLDATCNQGGTGGGWRDQYNETFRSADVIVVPHNDDAGRKHAEKIAKSLTGVAARIGILKLWESWEKCPVKGDFYDWRQAGHTREQFDALVDALPDYEPSADPAPADTIALEDFYAYMPAHQFIYTRTRELWPAASVDGKLPKVGKLKASTWLDKNRSVEQMTWAPGLPMIISDKVVKDSGWIDSSGDSVFNLYLPPTIAHGDPTQAGPWLTHVRRIYPDDADHVVSYLAHRVQRPDQKINHGLVLGGAPGVGKDTILEPVKRAVGPWNVQEVTPQQVLGRFNGYVKSVLLRINEARDLGEMNRFAFYEHMKVLLAAPPDVIRCDEKHLREHSVFNVTGVIITSNRKDSFHLPADDRRHYVCWTDLTQADLTKEYFDALYSWYGAGGYENVAAFLAQYDLANFSPYAPPKKTDAFWQIVETNRTPENSELADALDELGNPDAVTLKRIRQVATGDLLDWISDRKCSRQIPHRMSECGYVPVRNDTAKDGCWKIGGVREYIYAKADLSIRDRYAAVRALGT